MKKYYNIDYSQLMLLLLPVLLRNDLVKIFITSLVKPLDSLNNKFGSFIQSRQTNISAQKCYMQAMLNDEFDFSKRRIRVNTAPIDFFYFLLHTEEYAKPMMISKENLDEMGDPNNFIIRLLNRDGQIGAGNADFDVVLPIGYTLSTEEEKRMRVLINRNKITPKKYNIIWT